MRKQAYTIVALITFVVVLSVSAQAENSARTELRAHIPFEFTAGNDTLPAGDYTITQLSPASNQGLLQFRSRDGKSITVLLMNSVLRKAQEPKLVFNRYGAQYFLSQAWTGDAENGVQAPKSKAERSIASQVAKTERKIETVALTHH